MYITVTSEAVDKNLLSDEQLTAAVGDDATDDLNARLTADICQACGVAIDGSKLPTLRRETVVERFYDVGHRNLVLARRHAVAVTSIVADGETIDATDYTVGTESGIVRRRQGYLFTGEEVVVTYAAGFATVPADLVGVASDLARLRVAEASRDMLVKRESTDIPGVERRDVEYWVTMGGSTSTGSSTVPPELIARLSRYASVVV